MGELQNESGATISLEEKRQLLNRYITYRDDNNHIVLLLKAKSPPKTFSRFCQPCGTAKKFNRTGEQDLIDIECDMGHRYSIDPPSVEAKSQDLSTIIDNCHGCNERKTFTIDWATRKLEVDAWKVTDL